VFEGSVVEGMNDKFEGHIAYRVQLDRQQEEDGEVHLYLEPLQYRVMQKSIRLPTEEENIRLEEARKEKELRDQRAQFNLDIDAERRDRSGQRKTKPSATLKRSKHMRKSAPSVLQEGLQYNHEEDIDNNNNVQINLDEQNKNEENRKSGLQESDDNSQQDTDLNADKLQRSPIFQNNKNNVQIKSGHALINSEDQNHPIKSSLRKSGTILKNDAQINSQENNIDERTHELIQSTHRNRDNQQEEMPNLNLRGSSSSKNPDEVQDELQASRVEIIRPEHNIFFNGQQEGQQEDMISPRTNKRTNPDEIKPANVEKNGNWKLETL
jgi:hypothetical protein